MKESLLIIDDDEDVRILLKKTLGNSYDILEASSVEKGRELIHSQKVSLVILDEFLEDGKGHDFCLEVKQEPELQKVPIIMLSGKKELEHKLMAFNAGAEDYIVKPFEPLELMARIQAKLLNVGFHGDTESVLKFEDLTIKKDEYKAFKNDQSPERDLELTLNELKILLLLASNTGQIYSREQIIDKIWGNECHITDRVIDQHVSKLRKKMEIVEPTIETVRGVGYRFGKSVG